MAGRLDEWREWLRIINAEVVGQAHDRFMFRAMMEMIEKNPHLPKESVVYEWIISAYVASTVAAVRRQLDKRTDVVSMMRLLQDMIANPREITRKWFVAQYGTLPTGGRDFDKFVAKTGDEYIDKGRVQADADRLLDAGKIIRDFANKYIAHRDQDIALKRVTMRPAPTWEELNAAIDLLGELLKKYQLLLNQAGMIAVEPVIQEPWERVFQVPWLS